MTRRTVMVLGLAIAIAAAGALIAALMRSAPANSSAQFAPASGDAPPALARHLATLRALPGNGGESAEGPGGADAAALQALAYPDSDIPLARLETERLAAKAVKSRGFTSGRGRTGTWVSVGPKNALYPLFGMRDLTQYVPNAYYAASRINAMALSPSCRPGHCRMWIGPAGGGVWRTENALADTPSWKYLTGDFEINAIGSITLDPTDSTGNTIWVGTGEGNTCGSGCVHGQGLYKSTDGGDSWTGPYGKSVFGGRGVSSIAVDPGDADVVLRVVDFRAARDVVGVLQRHPTHRDSRREDVGPLQVDRRWYDVDVHPRRLGERGRLRERRSGAGGGERDTVHSARGPAGRARSVESRHRLLDLVRKRSVAVDRRGRDVDADQAVAQLGDHDHAAVDCRDDAAERQDSRIRRRRTHRQPRNGVQPRLPQRRRGDGIPGLVGSHECRPG